MRPIVSSDPLVLAAVNGDERAFEALVRRHRPDLHRQCARILGADADADDAVQETLVHAWRRLASFEGRSEFAGWLHGIATNACLDVLRARARGPHLVCDEALHERATRDEDPADATVRRDELRRVSLAARRALTDRQHSVLVLRNVLHLSAAETAARRGESVASVNSSLQRARAALHQTREDCLAS